MTTAAPRVLNVHRWSRMRFGIDVVVLYAAAGVALLAAPMASGIADRILAAAFPLVVLAALYARRNPDQRLHGSLLDTAGRVLGVVSLAAMMTLAVASILHASHPVDLALRLWLFGAVYLATARGVLLSARRNVVRSRALATPTLVVGAGVVGERLVRRLAEDPSYGMRPVGFLDADPLPTRLQPSIVPVLGSRSDLAATVAETGARHVILAFSSEPDHVLLDTVKECQKLEIDVSLVPRLYESINERVTLDHVGGIPLLSLRPTNPRSWHFAIKHAVDRVFAFLAVVALAPVMLLIAIAIRLTSPGPILFRQQRVGRDGREFTMLKFRTMRGDPFVEGEADAGWAAEIRGGQSRAGGGEENRVTAVGRLLRVSALDELPQLFNVLRGDMSFVGPRPERVGYVRDFERLVQSYAHRHRVKSGITGWAQVHGLRGQTSIADRVEWDNYYIQNYSLWLDLRIIVLTTVELLRFRG